MWPILPDFRWEPGRSHRATSRVEVWSQGSLIEKDAPILGGAVTEKWVTGIRASLTLSVPPGEWDDWWGLPALELRVYAGISWARSEFTCPLGIFPVMPPTRSLPVAAESVTADDRWQRVQQNDLLLHRQGWDWSAASLAAWLMVDSGLDNEVQISVSRDVRSPALMWDKSRHDLIVGYLEPIGAEAFVDRTGQAVIRDRTPSEGRDLTDGEDGTVVSITSTSDWSKVVNSVSAASTRNDVTVVPQLEQIDDWWHPAHESLIGRRTFRYTSPLIATELDARTAARAQLTKLSAPALSWSVSCVPDPTRMPGDLITVTTGLGAVRATVQEVTHPLGAGAQRVQLGAVL